MSHKFLTCIGTIFIIFSCILFTGDMVYNSSLEHYYKKAVEESLVYVPSVSSEETIKVLPMSGVVPTSVHEDLMLSYSNVLYIPTLKIKAKVFDGMNRSNLSKGVARDLSTMKLGDYGNCVIAGHSSTKYDCIFNGLENLRIGDMITAYTEDGLPYTYIIKSML